VAKDFLPQIKCASKKKIFFYGHDFHFRRKEQEPLVGLTSEQKDSEIKIIKEMETGIWEKVDTIYYPNKNEVAEVQQFCQHNKLNCDVRLLPVFTFEKFNEEAAENLSTRKDLLIVAGFKHLPNEEGVTWFVKNVWPSMIEEHNDLILNIVGSNPPQKIYELADKNIRVTGWVSDAELERYLRTCRVSVAPLLRGAGMKGKVVEALAWGLPVVTTSIGLQGLEGYNEIIPNCDGPRKMIQEINKLLKSDDIWIDRSKKSVALAKKLFSQIALQEALKGLY
jgi:glycosyltransferase involved in cell wall biosynthesis